VLPHRSRGDPGGPPGRRARRRSGPGSSRAGARRSR